MNFEESAQCHQTLSTGGVWARDYWVQDPIWSTLMKWELTKWEDTITDIGSHEAVSCVPPEEKRLVNKTW